MIIIDNILAIILYTLFFSWIFLKIRNIVLIKKLNCKESSKSIKKDVKKQKLSKCLFKISIVAIIIFAIFVVIGLVAVGLAILMTFVTLGGIAYIDTGYDSTFYYNLMNFVMTYQYIGYLIEFILYIVFIRAIYINIQCHKILKNSNILNTYIKEVTTESSNNINSKPKKHSIIWLIIISCIICIVAFLYFSNNNTNITKNTNYVDLEDVVQPVMNNTTQMTTNWYFFHNDRLYVYDFYNGDQFYSTNLSADNKNIISASEELRYANFFMIYNNEAFYYTEYNRGIKKINLSTGKISMVIDDKYLYLIPDTLNNGKVIVNYQNDYLNNAHTYFATLDLETGLLSNEKKIKYPANQPYFYHKDSNKIYYIDSNDGKNTIYEDNTIIYTYEADNNLVGWKSNIKSNISDTVFVQDNYIFAIIANKIVKFNLSNYEIIEEKELNDNFSLINSVRSGSGRTLGIEEEPAATSIYPLFAIVDKSDSTNSNIKKDGVYKFNSTTLSFEKIMNNYEGGFLQKYGDYFIFQSSTKTTIYNDKLKKYKIYDSANYSVENNNIYLMTYTGDFYHQKFNNLKFEIKKIACYDVLD